MFLQEKMLTKVIGIFLMSSPMSLGAAIAGLSERFQEGKHARKSVRALKCDCRLNEEKLAEILKGLKLAS